MVNETLIAQSENSNFFDVKVHLFCIQRPQTPQKLKGQIAKKRFIPQTQSFFTSNPRSELFQTDDVKTRPYGSENQGQMADGPRMTLIDDFGRSRQFPDPDRNDHCSLNTTIRKLLSAMLKCYRSSLYAPNFRLYDDCLCSLAFIEDWPPGGGVACL